MTVTSNGPRFQWRGTESWAAVPYLLAAIAAVTAVVALGHELHAHLDALERGIQSLGVWAPIAFVLVLVIATSLFVPGSLLSIAAGMLFGLWWGYLAVVAGGALACALQYGLARSLLGNSFQRLLDRRPKLNHLMITIQRDQLRLQFLARVTPLSPTLLSYLLGACRVRFWPFMLAITGQLPGYFVETWAGVAGERALRLPGRTGGAPVAEDLLVFGGLAAFAVAMFFITRAARQAISRAESAVDVTPASETA